MPRSPKPTFKIAFQEFKGKNVVIFGKPISNLSRDDVTKMVEDAGGTVHTRIKDNTNFVIYSDQLQLPNLQELTKQGIVAIPFRDFISRAFAAKANPKLVGTVMDLLFRLEDIDSRDFENVLLKHGVNFLEDLEQWETKDLLNLKKNIQKLLR